ncbi:hypothetical protein ABEV34_04915 [Methylorubrum rhodesianum]|uniref:hypothetical protein n=1 Tax=Methylorubrum rhodesianum TaxID=29427 RepID=UPI003D277686
MAATSRRALLASLAASPALSLPAVAAPVTMHEWAQADASLMKASQEVLTLQMWFEDHDSPDPTDEELDEAVGRQCDLIEAIIATPARTRWGLMSKVRALCYYEGLHPSSLTFMCRGTITERLILSLAADILWGEDGIVLGSPPTV